MNISMYNHHILNPTSEQVCQLSSTSGAYSSSDLLEGLATLDMLAYAQMTNAAVYACATLKHVQKVILNG